MLRFPKEKRTGMEKASFCLREHLSNPENKC
jgi:hypothetical protein